MMLSLTKTASGFQVSPGAVLLRKLLGADGIPDASMCSEPGAFIF